MKNDVFLVKKFGKSNKLGRKNVRENDLDTPKE